MILSKNGGSSQPQIANKIEKVFNQKLTFFWQFSVDLQFKQDGKILEHIHTPVTFANKQLKDTILFMTLNWNLTSL